MAKKDDDGVELAFPGADIAVARNSTTAALIVDPPGIELNTVLRMTEQQAATHNCPKIKKMRSEKVSVCVRAACVTHSLTHSLTASQVENLHSVQGDFANGNSRS